MSELAKRAEFSLDLRDEVADLADRADQINGDRRKLWIEVARDGFRVIRASNYGLGYEMMGFGGTIDDAVRRANDFLHDLHVTAESEAAECDRLDRAERAARLAAE